MYFWRWSIWKAFEQVPESLGVVALITGARWLDGPAFVGMREAVRRLCSEIWIVELGGDGRGTDPEENVFDIQTPVAIAVLIRAKPTGSSNPAAIWHRRIRGSRAEKLAAAASLRGPGNSPNVWTELPSSDGQLFKPSAGNAEWDVLPALTDLLPWQQPGAILTRSWPVAPAQGCSVSDGRGSSLTQTSRSARACSRDDWSQHPHRGVGSAYLGIAGTRR